MSNLPGQVSEKLFHRKKHDDDGVPVTPTTNSGSIVNDLPSSSTTADPGRVGRAENGVVARHEEEEEEVPQMNITTTVVSESSPTRGNIS